MVVGGPVVWGLVLHTNKDNTDSIRPIRLRRARPKNTFNAGRTNVQRRETFKPEAVYAMDSRDTGLLLR